MNKIEVKYGYFKIHLEDIIEGTLEGGFYVKISANQTKFIDVVVKRKDPNWWAFRALWDVEYLGEITDDYVRICNRVVKRAFFLELDKTHDLHYYDEKLVGILSFLFEQGVNAEREFGK